MFRANPSKKSHAELGACTEIDEGNIDEFAEMMSKMKKDWGLQVVGGCCGSDHKHIKKIAEKVYEVKDSKKSKL